MMVPIMFTPREAEIVTLLFQLGRQDKVRAALGLNCGGLKSHMRNIYRKSGTSSAIDLLAMAYRNGGYLW